MKILNFRSLWILTISICFFSEIFSQVSVMQFRNVPQENIEEFIHRETTYWSEVAQKAVNEGKMVGWSLWQRVGGWDMDDASTNFVFVNTFANAEGVDNAGSIWNAEAVFPDGRMSAMETGSLGKVIHQIYVRSEGEVGAGAPFQYARVNFAKASDLDAYINLEKNVWMPFAKKHIEGGTTTQKYWNVSRLLSPSGDAIPFNAFTVDGFNKLSEVLSPAMPAGSTFPSLDEFDEVHDKVYIQTYRLIKATMPKQ
ncbi:MAG: hypothetical protein HKN68_16865 [Saprospiraceae bacterium]|nr:hypothetical protein [Saprospiraceae bacterium]